MTETQTIHLYVRWTHDLTMNSGKVSHHYHYAHLVCVQGVNDEQLAKHEAWYLQGLINIEDKSAEYDLVSLIRSGPMFAEDLQPTDADFDEKLARFGAVTA